MGCEPTDSSLVFGGAQTLINTTYTVCCVGQTRQWFGRDFHSVTFVAVNEQN